MSASHIFPVRPTRSAQCSTTVDAAVHIAMTSSWFRYYLISHGLVELLSRTAAAVHQPLFTVNPDVEGQSLSPLRLYSKGLPWSRMANEIKFYILNARNAGRGQLSSE